MQAKDRSASTGSGLGGAARHALRTFTLLLVLLLVASIGLVIGTGSDEAEPSATELALAEGSAAAQALADTAATLEEASASADAGPYGALSEMLHLHAAALRPPGEATGAPSPIFSAAEPTTPASPATAGPPAPADFLADLEDSYTAAFEAATIADPGPARVLASAATAQWLYSRTLAPAGDAAVPAIPVPEVRYDDGAPDCAAGATLEPAPSMDGVRTAVLAEQRASYAYEVAAARAADPGQLLKRMAEHRDAEAGGAAVLAYHCVAEPLPAAGYELAEEFRSDPDGALRKLEEQLVGTYADLVGMSAPGPVRDWAIRQLAEAVHYVSGLPAAGPGSAAFPAFPGIDPSEYPRLMEPAASLGSWTHAISSSRSPWPGRC
ncbi:MAG: DUF4439 domain-containing protein [Actinomycetes bacterium]